MRRILLATIEYWLGFLALAIFAYLAFASGPATDERFVYAFKIASIVAVVELAVLLARASAANRLIIGANIWLAVGGAAAFLELWGVLRVYQRFGEAACLHLCLRSGWYPWPCHRLALLAKRANAL